MHHQSTIEVDNYSLNKLSHPISKKHITYLRIYKSRERKKEKEKRKKKKTFRTQNPTITHFKEKKKKKKIYIKIQTLSLNPNIQYNDTYKRNLKIL